MKVVAYNKQYYVVGYDLLNSSVLNLFVKRANEGAGMKLLRSAASIFLKIWGGCRYRVACELMTGEGGVQRI